MLPCASRIRDIEETTKELVYEESTSELNPLLEHGPVHDFSFVGPAAVQLRHYRSGQELFLEGEMRAAVRRRSARAAWRASSSRTRRASPSSWCRIRAAGRRKTSTAAAAI